MIYQPVPFPLHAIVRSSPNEEASCGCGWDACSRVGKHPAILWRDLEYTGIAWAEVSAGLGGGRGVGLKTGAGPRGSGVIVVDLDGEAAINKFYELNGESMPDGRIVQTGRGEDGLQLYFQHPGFFVKTSAGSRGGLWWNGKSGKDENGKELSQAIDIRGDGGMVVLEGSAHRSGNEYVLLTGDTPPAPCPAWLVEWFRKQPEPVQIKTYDGDIKDPDEREYRRELYRKYLAETEPCIQGGGGDLRLFEVVQYGAYDLALPTDDVLEDLEEVFDSRCVPPWGDELEERVYHKAHTAKTGSERARIEPLPDPARDPELAAIFAPVDVDLNMLDLEVVDRVATETATRKTKKPDGLHFGGWDQVVEPPEWLVHGLIPIESVGMFVALPSSIKTWTAVDIAIAVATGTPWLGRFPVRKGKVAIVDWESGSYELQRRVQLLSPNGEIENLGKWSMGNIPNIDDPALWKALGKVDGLQLCIFDSLAAGAPLTDENLKEAALPLHFAAKLSDARGTACLFIHHATKGDGGGDSRKTVRGSTAILGACDYVYSFEDVDDIVGEDGASVRRMKMVCVRASQSAKPTPVQLQLADATGLTWFDEDGASNANASAARAALGTARTAESIQNAIKLVLSSGEFMTKEKIRVAVGANSNVVSREIDQLVVDRELRKGTTGGYALDGAELREARVRKLIAEHPYHRTEAALANTAKVLVEDVQELVMVGKLSKSGEGRWLAS